MLQITRLLKTLMQLRMAALHYHPEINWLCIARTVKMKQKMLLPRNRTNV